MNVAEQFMKGSPYIFFYPNERFFEFIGQLPYRYKKFTDMGCGNARLTRMMREKGFECKAVDLYTRDNAEVDDVQEVDYQTLNFGEDDCLLFARPSHDGACNKFLSGKWNVYATRFYIGLEKNVEDDLLGLEYEQVAEDVGCDGEHIWRVWGRKEHLNQYFLIHSRYWLEPGWMKQEKGYWRNDNGGGFNIGGEEILDSKYMPSADALGVPKETLCREDTDSGWIAPDGEWFGAAYAEHDIVMYSVIGISVARGEKIGFIRCAGGKGKSKINKYWTYRGTGKPTRFQRRVLSEKGYDPKDLGDLHSDTEY